MLHFVQHDNNVIMNIAKELNKLGVLDRGPAENTPSEPDMYNHNAGKLI